jgi:hypothetical protein
MNADFAPPPPRSNTITAWLMVLLLVPSPCIAAPPADIDLNGPLHLWFDHQHSVTGAWCCKVADGHILSDAEWRISKGHYEVWIDNKWRVVPPTSLRSLEGGPNPTGHAIVWWTRTEREIVILCFTPGSGL